VLQIQTSAKTLTPFKLQKGQVPKRLKSPRKIRAVLPKQVLMAVKDGEKRGCLPLHTKKAQLAKVKETEVGIAHTFNIVFM
jgi:hypothetical protein